VSSWLLILIFSLKAIEKTIVNSDVGMTPNNDGEVIRLSIPQLTSDRRKVFSTSIDGVGSKFF
jgi:ribosome recycling factor